MSTPKIPVLLFTMGKLQVFQYETPGQPLVANFWWQEEGELFSNGPFPTLFATMQHYTWIIATRKEQDKLVPKENLIEVDFKAKKRVPKPLSLV